MRVVVDVDNTICEARDRNYAGAMPITEVIERLRLLKAAGAMRVNYTLVPQDTHLAENQAHGFRCGDNGIFKGMPLTAEQKQLSKIARNIYAEYPSDGKYVLDGDRLIICQSNAYTNRKLGSDMADGVTGGGLHGKDLSKADVSVNIWCFLEAQKRNAPVQACCAIGDEFINGIPYAEIVETARTFISECGGFEKFAEWGLF